MEIYLQVRANPPIRFAEWSGDKNLYCMANITTCIFGLVGYGMKKRFIFPYSTRACVITFNVSTYCDAPAHPLCLPADWQSQLNWQLLLLSLQYYAPRPAQQSDL